MERKRFAIILAGGEGHRSGALIPKQFVEIAGRPVVWWSMKAFKEAYPDITLILVVHPGFFDDWDLIFANLPEENKIEHIISCGGLNRSHSVYNGLLSIRDYLNDNRLNPEECEITVAIHDGARPVVGKELITRGFSRVQPGQGMVPAIRSVCSLREVDEPEKMFEESRSRSIDRNRYAEVQTPQIFMYDELMEAYKVMRESNRVFSDDASLAESFGIRIMLFEGNPDNIKITHPSDFKIAEVLLK